MQTNSFLKIIAGVIIMTSFSSAQVQGEGEYIEASLKNRSDILFYGGFERDIPGTDNWSTTWGTLWSNPNRSSEISTVSSTIIPGGNAIRVNYPQGGFGPDETGTQWPLSLEKFPEIAPTYDSLYLRYYVKFEEGFDFVKGGKLPGLTGGKDSYSRSGGDQPDGTNGWTMRFMWRTDGAAVVYAYLPDGKYKEGVWGTDLALGKKFIPGQWHCVEQFIKVNSIGNTDGKLKVWFDDEQVLDLADVNYRTAENENGKVGGFYFSTFHGGSDNTWAPSVDSYTQFDGIVIAKERVGLYETLSSTKVYLIKNEHFTLDKNQLLFNSAMLNEIKNIQLVAIDGKSTKFKSSNIIIPQGVHFLKYDFLGKNFEHQFLIK